MDDLPSQHQTIVKATHCMDTANPEPLNSNRDLSLGHRAQKGAGLMGKGLPWLGVEPSQSREAALGKGKAGDLPGTSAKLWYPSAVSPWGITTGTAACALLLPAEVYSQEGSYRKGKFSSWKNVPGHLCMARASHEMAAALCCRAGTWLCPTFPTPAPPCPFHLINEVSRSDEHQETLFHPRAGAEVTSRKALKEDL